jgi:hypothetical protein
MKEGANGERENYLRIKKVEQKKTRIDENAFQDILTSK